MRGVKLPVRRLRRRRCFAARRERREKPWGHIRLRGPRSRGWWRPVLSLAMPGYSRGCFGASGLAPAWVLVEPQPSYTPWLARLLHLHKARRRGGGVGSAEKRGLRAPPGGAFVCPTSGTVEKKAHFRAAKGAAMVQTSFLPPE